MAVTSSFNSSVLAACTSTPAATMESINGLKTEDSSTRRRSSAKKASPESSAARAFRAAMMIGAMRASMIAWITAALVG